MRKIAVSCSVFKRLFLCSISCVYLPVVVLRLEFSVGSHHLATSVTSCKSVVDYQRAFVKTIRIPRQFSINLCETRHIGDCETDLALIHHRYYTLFTQRTQHGRPKLDIRAAIQETRRLLHQDPPRLVSLRPRKVLAQQRQASRLKVLPLRRLQSPPR